MNTSLPHVSNCVRIGEFIHNCPPTLREIALFTANDRRVNDTAARRDLDYTGE
jgi:hypothetical protein